MLLISLISTRTHELPSEAPELISIVPEFSWHDKCVGLFVLRCGVFWTLAVFAARHDQIVDEAIMTKKSAAPAFCAIASVFLCGPC